MNYFEETDMLMESCVCDQLVGGLETYGGIVSIMHRVPQGCHGGTRLLQY